MSLAYFPAANCLHCTCLGDGGRCCYCRYTRGMLAGLPPRATLEARSRVSNDCRAPSSHAFGGLGLWGVAEGMGEGN